MAQGKVLRFIAARFGFEYDNGKLKNLNKSVGASARRMKLAKREARKFRRELRRLSSVARVVVGGYIGYKAVKALTSFADEADDAAKKSQAAAMTAKQWQRLSYATERTGADVKIAAKSFQRLARTMNNARLGSKRAVDSFKDLNIEVERGGKLRSTYEVFLEVSSAFSEMADTAENATLKTALAQEIFGRSGAEMMVLLNEGPEKIKQYGDRFERLGFILDKKGAAKGEKFKDSMLDLTVILKGLRNRIALSVLPSVTEFAEGIARWWSTGNNATKALGKMKAAAKQAGIALAGVVTAKILTLLNGLKNAFYAGARAALAMGKAGWLAVAKFAAIGIAIAAVVVAVQDLIVFAKGGTSEIGKMLGDTAYSQGLRRDLQAVGEALKSLWDVVAPLAKQILPALLKVFLAIVEIVTRLIVGIRDVVRWIVALVKKIPGLWAGMVSGLKGALGSVKKAFSTVWKYLKKGFLALGSAVMYPIKKIIDAYNWVKRKLGGGKEVDLGGSAAGALDIIKGATKKAKTTNVGIQNPKIQVALNGSPSMTPEQVKETIRGGVSKGLTDMISQSWSDVSPAEAG